jgi:hypothetical protein
MSIYLYCFFIILNYYNREEELAEIANLETISISKEKDDLGEEDEVVDISDLPPELRMDEYDNDEYSKRRNNDDDDEQFAVCL